MDSTVQCRLKMGGKVIKSIELRVGKDLAQTCMVPSLRVYCLRSSFTILEISAKQMIVSCQGMPRNVKKCQGMKVLFTLQTRMCLSRKFRLAGSIGNIPFLVRPQAVKDFNY